MSISHLIRKRLISLSSKYQKFKVSRLQKLCITKSGTTRITPAKKLNLSHAKAKSSARYAPPPIHQKKSDFQNRLRSDEKRNRLFTFLLYCGTGRLLKVLYNQERVTPHPMQYILVQNPSCCCCI